MPLTDSDEDHVYTGSTIVDRFGPGPRPVPPGVEPVSFPVRIVQDYSEVIKDFGTVKLDGDKTFEASVSFPVDDCPIISPTPEQCGDSDSGSGSSDDDSSDSGSDNNAGSGGSSGGSGSGGSGTSGSGTSGSGDSGGGSGSTSSGSGDSDSGGSGSSGFSNDGEGSGSPSGGATSGIRGLLPSTGGGVALWVLGMGILLIGGGLLVRRITR